MTIVAWILLVFGALNVFANYSVLVYAYRTGKGSSLIPLFGGVFAFAGCALLPVIGWRWGLLALAIDPGCSGFVAGALVMLVQSRG